MRAVLGAVLSSLAIVSTMASHQTFLQLGFRDKNAALLEEKNDLPDLLVAQLAPHLPAQWDARVDHACSAKCADLINPSINHVGNQGTCGSCYAWAALGTASINACLAGHTINRVNGFSIQDVLSCGGIWEADFQNNVLKADIAQGVNGQTFAGGCEGHFAGNVFEYDCPTPEAETRDFSKDSSVNCTLNWNAWNHKVRFGR